MNNSVAAPPLLLAVLVQVVAEACRYRLRAALYSQVDSTTNSTSHDQLAESQVLLGLLESTPRPPTTPLPRIHAFGHGYPDSCLVNLCVAMCKCASEPDCPLALPVVKLEGVQESNPFQDKIEHHLSQERDYDQDLDTNGVLRREVARVVAMIDDDIDLMNVQEVQLTLLLPQPAVSLFALSCCLILFLSSISFSVLPSRAWNLSMVVCVDFSFLMHRRCRSRMQQSVPPSYAVPSQYHALYMCANEVVDSCYSPLFMLRQRTGPGETRKSALS